MKTRVSLKYPVSHCRRPQGAQQCAYQTWANLLLTRPVLFPGRIGHADSSTPATDALIPEQIYLGIPPHRHFCHA